MIEKYIRTGRCIFCQRSEPFVSFKSKPHIMPKTMGGNIIGVDICDDCNHFFGTPGQEKSKYLLPCSIEETVKEVFNITRCLLSTNTPLKYGRLKSRFFEYRASKNRITVKKQFRLNGTWLKQYARLFRRGLYELFLQSYHIQEGKDSNESKFDKIREFARYDKGDIPVYYAHNGYGIYLVEKDLSHPKFYFSEHQFETIEEYGFYCLMIYGLRFYLAVTQKAEIYKDEFLSNEVKSTGSAFCAYIKPIEYITDIDFTLEEMYKRTKS